VPSEQRPHQPGAFVPSVVENLTDGDLFSVDGGFTWHVCALVLYGNVAVYVTPRRDEDAPTLRVDADRDAPCLILTCAAE